MARKKQYLYDNDPAVLYSNYKRHYRDLLKAYFMNSIDFECSDKDVINKESKRYIKEKFYNFGKCSAFKHDVIDTVVFADFTPYNLFALYGVPTHATPINEYSVPGFPTKMLKVNEEIVIGYINEDRSNVRDLINFYADRIANVEMVINTNLQLSKIPYLIGLGQEDKQQAETIVNQILNNEIVVFASLEELERVKAFASGAPYIIDKLYAYKNSLLGEALTKLGIDNSSDLSNKIYTPVDGINSNNESINQNAQAYIDNLNEWFDDIKTYLGVEIKAVSKHKITQSVYENEDASNEDTESEDDLND